MISILTWEMWTDFNNLFTFQVTDELTEDARLSKNGRYFNYYRYDTVFRKPTLRWDKADNY